MRKPELLATVLVLACHQSTAPAFDLQGTWSANYDIPGSSLVLNITESAGVLQGTGTYSMEAGTTGSVFLTGTHSGRDVTLVINYDVDLVLHWTGTITDSRHMTGTVDQGTAGATTLAFTRDFVPLSRASPESQPAVAVTTAKPGRGSAVGIS